MKMKMEMKIEILNEISKIENGNENENIKWKY